MVKKEERAGEELSEETPEVAEPDELFDGLESTSA